MVMLLYFLRTDIKTSTDSFCLLCRKLIAQGSDNYTFIDNLKQLNLYVTTRAHSVIAKTIKYL